MVCGGDVGMWRLYVPMAILELLRAAKNVKSGTHNTQQANIATQVHGVI